MGFDEPVSILVDRRRGPSVLQGMTTVKPFKSERAAKMAMTKAEKAFVDARCEARCAFQTALDKGMEDPFAYTREKEAAVEPVRAQAQAVYDQAQAQKFFVRSYCFGPNTTRDLIAANMD